MTNKQEEILERCLTLADILSNVNVEMLDKNTINNVSTLIYLNLCDLKKELEK